MIQTRLVRARTARPMRIRCTVWDQGLAGAVVPFAFFYDRKLDDASLVRGLEQALAVVPVAAGRLCSTDGELQIASENQGVPFSVVRSDLGLLDTMRLITENRSKLWVEMINTAKARKGRAPLFMARVTHLADGSTVLGCCWHHLIGDMLSFMLFMKAWSAAVAGETMPEALVVADRPGYLDARLPEGGSKESPIKRLGFAEIGRYVLYMALSRFRKKPLLIYFGDDEIARMREAYSASDIRLSTHDVLCGHVMEAIQACDPEVERRNLCVAVNYRKRMGLEESLIGNIAAPVVIACARHDPAVSIARRIRSKINRFDEDHMNYRATVRFVERIGGPRSLSRCAMAGMEPMDRNITISNWCNLGIYDVSFGGSNPVYVFGVTANSLPWFAWLTEGFANRGRLFYAMLPTDVTDRLVHPAMSKRLHRFREADDPIPELARHVGCIP